MLKCRAEVPVVWRSWLGWRRDEDARRQQPRLMLSMCAGGRSRVAREKLVYRETFFFNFFSLQRVFILNQKAHYGTCRSTCPFYILQKCDTGQAPEVDAIIDKQKLKYDFKTFPTVV